MSQDEYGAVIIMSIYAICIVYHGISFCMRNNTQIEYRIEDGY
jgi:hypothetical protein